MTGSRRNPPGAILHRLAFPSSNMSLQEMGIAVCGARRTEGAFFAVKAAKVTCEACKAKIQAARKRAAEARR